MPDLTIENKWTCATNLHWSLKVPGSKNTTHTVSWSREHKNTAHYQYDYSCTCHAYKFKPGYCKHIESVKGQHCGWDQFIRGGEPKEVNGVKVCPCCAGPLEIMRHGV